jgi:hypothetical protein
VEMLILPILLARMQSKLKIRQRMCLSVSNNMA